MFSMINDLFTCFKLPSAVLNKNFSIVYKYNFNDVLLNVFNNSNLVNDLKNEDFMPSISSFIYNDANYSCIKFFHCTKNPAYFIVGPYILKNENDKSTEDNLPLNEIDKNSLDMLLKFYNEMLNSFCCKNKRSYSPLVSSSIEYIDKNYSEPITIDNICSNFNVNKCYFCSLFKKETGLTFVNYLNSYKIEKSKELLKDSSLSLLDISLAVGFNNQSYYSTTFKKFTNMTPLEYRSSLY